MTALQEIRPNIWTLNRITHFTAKDNIELRKQADFEEAREHGLSQYYEWDCNEIRTKINRLLRSGEMKVTQFQKELGIASQSYGSFMRRRGPDAGQDNITYHTAHKFFQRRKELGVKEPTVKKAKVEELAEFDVTGVTLDGEAIESVPVHDTCDDVRRKIQAHLRNPNITQAAFCREIAKAFAGPKKIQSKLLTDFLRKKGPTEGNTSSVYYGAYVYFEKLRIQKGGKKTAKRLESESIYPDGMDTENLRNRRVWCTVPMRS